VLSGNRNFEGRIHPLVKTNWLASPPLVVAYALAGNMNVNLTRDPLGTGKNGQPVYLKDIWPSGLEIAQAVEQVTTEMFHKEYAEVFEGTPEWKAIHVDRSDTYDWQEDSTYIRLSPFFDQMGFSLSRWKIFTARVFWRCSAIRSPRTTSLRPGVSSRTARPDAICRNTASRALTLTPTVPAAATMR
jgi:aconitase A